MRHRRDRFGFFLVVLFLDTVFFATAFLAAVARFRVGVRFETFFAILRAGARFAAVLAAGALRLGRAAVRLVADFLEAVTFFLVRARVGAALAARLLLLRPFVRFVREGLAVAVFDFAGRSAGLACAVRLRVARGVAGFVSLEATERF